MGFLDSLGVSSDFVGTSGFSGIGSWALIVFLLFLFVVIAGIGTFFYYSRKAQKVTFKTQIPIFQNINGKHHRIGIDRAKEVFVPDSNVSLFFLKDKKIYIARPTRAMGKDEYWYSISENGEWVNFDMSSAPEADTLAQANYDHRDTRYAYINLKDIIKRNYSDKAVKWWKEYSHVITFIIVAFIFVASVVIILSKIGGLITKLGVIAENFDTIADKMGTAVQNAQNINSGVVTG